MDAERIDQFTVIEVTHIQPDHLPENIAGGAPDDRLGAQRLDQIDAVGEVDARGLD